MLIHLFFWFTDLNQKQQVDNKIVILTSKNWEICQP